MQTPLFVLIGEYEPDSDAEISILYDRLHSALAGLQPEIKMELRDELVIIEQQSPGFTFYVALTRNDDHQTKKNWEQLANDFELPWDKRPIDQAQMKKIFAYLKAKGWPKYSPNPDIGIRVLETLQQFRSLKVFSIPSAEGF